ncbi:MAG: T9SS type A sorting domain-containing protein [Bacteroidota bacterium]
MLVLFVTGLNTYAQDDTHSTVVANLTRTSVTCDGGSDGTATLNPTGGVEPYSFIWSTGDTTATVTGLSAGPYGFTITDAVGAVRIADFSILSLPPIVANASSTPIAGCRPGDIGVARVAPTGGTPPYSISWSNGVMGTTITSFDNGAFGYTITDSNGCEKIGGIAILEPTPIEPNVIRRNITCFGDMDGLASLNPTGGEPPYSFLWNTGDTISTLEDIGPALYQYTITDARACTFIGEFSIQTPWDILPRLTFDTGVCFGGGTASLDPVEGTPPYTFEWSTGSTESFVDGLQPGDYSFTVTDANGCTESDEFTIGDQEAQVFCFISLFIAPLPGQSNGVLDVEAVGGTPPYTFEWSDGQTGPRATGLAEGTYSVTTTDSEGCTTVCALALLPTPCVNVTDPGVIGFDQVICGAGNDPDPIISLEPASGGEGTLEYMWMSSTGPTVFNNYVWEPIPNTNSPSYDPGPIFETTFFIRCVRRDDCTTFLESNFVVVEVGDDAIAEIDGPLLLCQESSATYTAITNTPDAEVSWQIAGPLYPASATANSITVNTGSFGIALLTLTVTENGCTATNTFRINISAPPEFCDQYQDTFGDHLIAAFPNPSNGTVSVRFPEGLTEGGMIQVFSSNGQRVLEQLVQPDEWQVDLDLTTHPSGIYLARIITNDGRINTLSISLQKAP